MEDQTERQKNGLNMPRGADRPSCRDERCRTAEFADALEHALKRGPKRKNSPSHNWPREPPNRGHIQRPRAVIDGVTIWA